MASKEGSLQDDFIGEELEVWPNARNIKGLNLKIAVNNWVPLWKHAIFALLYSHKITSSKLHQFSGMDLDPQTVAEKLVHTDFYNGMKPWSLVSPQDFEDDYIDDDFTPEQPLVAPAAPASS